LKNYFSIKAFVLSFVFSAIFIINTSIVIAGIANSTSFRYTVSGREYFNTSTIITTDNTAQARSTVGAHDFRTVSNGHMGVRARMYNASNNALVRETAWLYNSTAVAQMSEGTTTLVHVPIITPIKGNSYYSQGMSAGWNGSSYTTHNTNRSPSQTVQ